MKCSSVQYRVSSLILFAIVARILFCFTSLACSRCSRGVELQTVIMRNAVSYMKTIFRSDSRALLVRPSGLGVCEAGFFCFDEVVVQERAANRLNQAPLDWDGFTRDNARDRDSISFDLDPPPLRITGRPSNLKQTAMHPDSFRKSSMHRRWCRSTSMYSGPNFKNTSCQHKNQKTGLMTCT